MKTALSVKISFFITVLGTTHLALGVARPVFSTFCGPSGDTSGRESGILTPYDKQEH